MPLNVTASKNIPIWVTTRNPDGSLGDPVFDLSLSVGNGASESVTWDGGLGLCDYPLGTDVCTKPDTFSVVTQGLTVTSTVPSSIPGLLPHGITPLSNFVSSLTCLHFVGINPNNGKKSLCSFRPLDFVAENPGLVSWNDFPSEINQGTSFYINFSDGKLIVIAITLGSLVLFSFAAPEYVDSIAPTAVIFPDHITVPVTADRILKSVRIEGFPYILYLDQGVVHLWSNDPTILNAPLSLDMIDGSSISAVGYTSIANVNTFWFAGSSTGNALLFKYTVKGGVTQYQTDQESNFLAISPTPTEIYFASASGLWSFDLTSEEFTHIGGSPCVDVLATAWGIGDIWNPLPGDATPIVLGVDTLVPRTVPLGLGSSTLLTTEHYSYAILEETPVWSTGIIPPTLLDHPRWDDRVIYNAPTDFKSVTTYISTYLIPSPPNYSITLTDTYTPLDPSGSLIINLSITPTTQRVSGGLNLIADSQAYQAYYPNTKLTFPQLTVTAPTPRLASVPAYLFPPTLGQAQLGVVSTSNTTPTPAFKAIQLNGSTLVSIIALNTSYIKLGTDTAKLNPILIDYVYIPPLGSTHVVATLYTQDSSVVVDVPIYIIS